jgi:hypothetical protein
MFSEDTFLILYEEAAHSMWLSLHFPFAPLTRIEVGTLLFSRLRPYPKKIFSFSWDAAAFSSHSTPIHSQHQTTTLNKTHKASVLRPTHAAAQGR